MELFGFKYLSFPLCVTDARGNVYMKRLHNTRVLRVRGKYVEEQICVCVFAVGASSGG